MGEGTAGGTDTMDAVRGYADLPCLSRRLGKLVELREELEPMSMYLLWNRKETPGIRIARIQALVTEPSLCPL